MFSPRQFLYDRYKDLETEEHRLLYLFLEVTRKCNLSCLHCGSDCGASEPLSVLSPESWFSIVDYAADRFSRDLLFVVTGGEPLLWPHLAGLGRRIQGHGMRWGLVTNGYALDRAVLDRLLAAGLWSLTISLDGDEAAHNRLRGNRASYGRALAAISCAGRSSLAMADVVTCVTPAALDLLPSMARVLLDKGIRRWRLFRIFPKGRAAQHPELLLDREGTRRLLEWIRENRRAYRKRGLAVDWSCEGWLPWGLDRRVRSEPFFCRAGISIASILCDGAVTGCPNNGPAFRVGDVPSDDFKRLWDEGFARFRDRSWMRRGLCADCRHFAHCRGGSVHLWDGEAGTATRCLLMPPTPSRGPRAPRRG